MTIKQFLDWKLGRFPAGKAIAVGGGVLLFAIASSMLSGKPDESGEVPKNQLEQWMEDAFNQGVTAEQARQEGFEEGAEAVEEAVFGDSLDSARLAELTELDNAYEAASSMVDEAIVCRAAAWRDRAAELASTDGINPTLFLDAELDARRTQLRAFQTDQGDLRMGAQQLATGLPLMVEAEAIALALRSFKSDWLAVDAAGNPRPLVELPCRASTFGADSAIANYLFQVGARREVEANERETNEALSRDVDLGQEDESDDS